MMRCKVAGVVVVGAGLIAGGCASVVPRHSMQTTLDATFDHGMVKEDVGWRAVLLGFPHQDYAKLDGAERSEEGAAARLTAKSGPAFVIWPPFTIQHSAAWFYFAEDGHLSRWTVTTGNEGS